MPANISAVPIATFVDAFAVQLETRGLALYEWTGCEACGEKLASYVDAFAVQLETRGLALYEWTGCEACGEKLASDRKDRHMMA